MHGFELYFSDVGIFVRTGRALLRVQCRIKLNLPRFISRNLRFVQITCPFDRRISV